MIRGGRIGFRPPGSGGGDGVTSVVAWSPAGSSSRAGLGNNSRKGIGTCGLTLGGSGLLRRTEFLRLRIEPRFAPDESAPSSFSHLCGGSGLKGVPGRLPVGWINPMHISAFAEVEDV